MCFEGTKIKIKFYPVNHIFKRRNEARRIINFFILNGDTFTVSFGRGKEYIMNKIILVLC